MYSNYPMKASKNATEGYFLNMLKGTCKNLIGIKTSIKLINREVLNKKFVKKIYLFLKRSKFYVGDKDKCGYISFQLWGGNEMLKWCEKKLKK